MGRSCQYLPCGVARSPALARLGVDACCSCGNTKHLCSCGRTLDLASINSVLRALSLRKARSAKSVLQQKRACPLSAVTATATGVEVLGLVFPFAQNGGSTSNTFACGVSPEEDLRTVRHLQPSHFTDKKTEAGWGHSQQQGWTSDVPSQSGSHC